MSRKIRSTLAFWAIPACALLGGAGYLAASIAGGHPAEGVVLCAVMAAAAGAFVLAARRSETLRGLMDRRDERITGMDLHATAVSGGILIVAVLVGMFVEMARGHSGAPYTWLATVAGVSYIAAFAVLRVRR